MKKIFKSIIVALSVILYSSCDALDLSPIDHYGSGNFWNTEAQVHGYMNGIHSQLRGSYQMFFALGEARGGTLKSGTSTLGTSLDWSDPIKNNQFSKDKTGISNWNGMYNKIMQINHFIDQVENGCSFLNDNKRAYYLGQAYGLRALYYSYLYRTYGGVPLIEDVKVLDGKISAEKLYTKRSSAEEILTFIKEDISRSEKHFGDNLSGENKNWTKYATLMLKAEMYLWSAKVTTGDHQANKEDAKVAKDVLKQLEGKFTLLNDFSKVFTDKGNKEIIFALRFKDDEATNWAANFLYSKEIFVGQRYSRDGEVYGDVLDLRGNGLLRHEYKSSLWEKYDDNDQRRDKTFLDHYDKDGKNQGLVMLKGLGIINANGNRVYESDIVVYRYSDVLLLLAEVENLLGGDCSKYVNEVRKRAYGEDFNAELSFVKGSFEENELAILAERDKEFVWEGKRWFDMVRMQDADGKPLAFKAEANYSDVVGEAPLALLKSTETYKLLWPVDRGTLNNDPELTQTPGYDEAN